MNTYTLTIDISTARVGDVAAILNFLNTYGVATQSGTTITLAVQVGAPPTGVTPPATAVAAVDLWDLRNLVVLLESKISQWVNVTIPKPVKS